ncbi:hypothetical protein N826_06215 [Skermanella aerolata KACC 11604]|uniref:PAS domain-containing protein n=3 Tax=Skermanella aerolata TaxID=393310 RepID=UPI0005C9A5F2|nr:PAS domain-containing protein [Skermanella aerolata]KJB90131.1 hypothetical protein N826_06215 [Skermanella aerolata KACC 11604]
MSDVTGDWILSDFPAADHGLGALIRRHKWSETALGTPATWPQPLRTLVEVMLGSSQPMFVAWGPERTLLYNDAYAPILATKHPDALGRSFLDVWHEIRDDLVPIVDQAFAGQPVQMDNIALVMQRNGYPEETHFAFSYTPVRDKAGAVAGLFCACQEITGQVLAERQLRDGEARLRGVVDGMDESFALLDHDFRILDVNDEAMRLETRPRAAIVGRTHWDAYPGSEHSELGSLYRRAMTERVPVALEHRHVWEDGRAAWLSMRAYPVADGLAIFYRDVTERRRAEKRERERVKRAREDAECVQLALDAGAIVGTWIWDLPTDHFTADERFARSFGLDAGLCRRGLGIRQVMASIHPDDHRRVAEAIAEVRGRGGPYRCQYCVRQHDGAYRWIEANGRVELAADGTSLRFPGVLLDIDERRGADAALHETGERYRLAARATNDAIWDWRIADGHVIWNEALGTLFGYPDTGTTAQWWLDHIHADDRARIDRDIHAVIEGSGAGWNAEYRFRRADGSYADILDRGFVLRDEDGRAVRMIGAMLDLTERKRAEAAVHESEERARLAVEAADIGIWDLDVGTGELRWDARTRALFGLSARAPVSYQGSFLAGLHPDDSADVQAAIAAALAPEGPGEFQMDYRTLGLEDGVERWIAARGRTVVRHGRVVRFIGTVIDVTGRRRSEDQLRELNENLEARVAERTAELNQAHEALRQSQKMEAVGQLTGGIAHDFNNMLAVVIGSLDLLGRRLGSADPRVRRYVDNALEGARRAAVLTQRLLAFSRQQPLRPEPVDANRLVAGMSDLLRHALGADIRLETVLAGGLWRSHADPNQLKNTILNLAVNARDAMPGGGRLTIETQNAHLDARYATAHPGVVAGQYVLVAVTDTGTGMAAEVVTRAFDPFFTTKEVGRGTGLGLSQVYGFVKQSDGHVKIYSEPGQGTTVKVYLPRLIGAEHDVAAERQDAEVPLGDRREVVLVVEDEPTVREFSVDALTELGYRVLEADGAAAALRLLEAHPDIVLLFTDIVMPDINGRKLADEALRRRPELKVLFTTGYTRNAVVHNGVLDPGVELIGKPFTLEELAAKVRAVLDDQG